jgi:hypothetical protein
MAAQEEVRRRLMAIMLSVWAVTAMLPCFFLTYLIKLDGPKPTPLHIKIPLMGMLLATSVCAFGAMDNHTDAIRIASELREAVFETGDEQ